MHPLDTPGDAVFPPIRRRRPQNVVNSSRMDPGNDTLISAEPAPSHAFCTMRGEPAFTLLEILATLAVLGLMLADLTNGMQFGLRAVQSQARLGIAGNDLTQVNRTLRALIAPAWPGGIEDQSEPGYDGGTAATHGGCWS